jgi:glycosyltransferase involved in cell wall biosynthesis
MTTLSIVIPFYNAEQTIGRCLTCVEAALRPGMEVILVDDGSTDGSVRDASRFPFELIRLPARSGPAAARNRGAEKARGEYLLFLDSDVLVRPGTFEALLRSYSENPQIVGVSAIYSDRAVAPGLFQEFKALEETYKYSAYRADRYSAFDTACGSVRRDVFHEVGGFNSEYSDADTEDVELGYSIARKYRNCINPGVAVDHVYAGHPRGIRNYCRRTFFWVRLFLSRRQFDQAVTTSSNASSVLLASTAALAMVLGFWRVELLWLGLTLLLAFVAWNIRFFSLAAARVRLSGAYKLIPFLFYLYTLQLAVGVGATAGLLYWPIRSLAGRAVGRAGTRSRLG